MRVWYDEEIGQIWMEGQDRPYPRRSLVASLEADEKVGIRLAPSGPIDLIVKTHFSAVRDHDGAGFASQDAAKAYLDGVFARQQQAFAVVQEETAAIALGGHRVVARSPAGIVYASCDDASTVDVVLGITLGAVEAGAVPQVVPTGPIREPSWAWAAGPVYLGRDGALTQIAPTQGAVVQVAVATSATTIFVAIQEPFHLAT